jgi:hypothetical protein
MPNPATIFVLAAGGLLLAAYIRWSLIDELRARVIWDRWRVDFYSLDVDDQAEYDFLLAPNWWAMFWQVWRPLTARAWWPKLYNEKDEFVPF